MEVAAAVVAAAVAVAVAVAVVGGGECGGARHLRAAAELELADHRALGVVGGGAREEEALRQLLLVELGEDVLVREEGVRWRW